MAHSRKRSIQQGFLAVRGCRRRGIGCLLIICLLIGTLCLGLTWFLSTQTAAAENAPLAVWLLIDNSNSMFEKDDIGTDPDLLRLDAARLFLSYLGVDEPDQIHKAAVIFFGSEAKTAVPLTPLTDDNQRSQLFSQIGNPSRMGWTNHLAALELAQTQLADLPPSHRPVIVLVTDGKSEDDTRQQEEIIAALQAKSDALAATNIPLYIVLLANETTDNDPEVAAIWQPLWQEMSAATSPGQFFIARDAADLPSIYHDVLISLTDNQSEGVVLETAVSNTGHEAPITVPPNLDQLTLVISKEYQEQIISLTTAEGIPIQVAHETVRHAGGNGQTREEIWVIEDPQPGEWTIQVDGVGTIIVWQDSRGRLEPVSTEVLTAVLTADLTPDSNPAIPTIHLSPIVTPTVTAIPIVNVLPTATASQTTVPITIHADPNANAVKKEFPLPWVLSGLALLGGFTTIFYWRKFQPAPHVTGTLRLLAMPSEGQSINGRTVIDLDTLNQTLITIGKPPATIPLTGANAQAAIRPGAAIEDIYEMVISGHGQVSVNGHPIPHETKLIDTAVIDLGGVKLRYENLRLRRVEREGMDSNQ